MKEKWTEEEMAFLREHWGSETKESLAEKLNRPISGIEGKAYKLNLIERTRKRKTWTEEEVDFLQEKWGQVSIKSIAKNLGRSVDAIKMKAGKIGLTDARFSYEGITLHQLAKATGISYSVWKNWVRLYDFPVRRKIFAQTYKVQVVNYDDFWKWAKANRQMIDFSRIEKNILGPEPDWVESKRNADFIKRTKIKKSNNNAWTTEEDNILKGMLSAYKHTYPEISQRLNRSEGAIKRRIHDLGLKARPVRLPNHVKYTEEEVQLIVELFDKGHCLEDIAHRINKSALGVRGKLERMGYYFLNGVPVKTEKKSEKEIFYGLTKTFSDTEGLARSN